MGRGEEKQKASWNQSGSQGTKTKAGCKARPGVKQNDDEKYMNSFDHSLQQKEKLKLGNYSVNTITVENLAD